MKSLSLVIPTLGQSPTLVELIDSVLEQDSPLSLVEIILVWQGDIAAGERLASQYSGFVKLICTKIRNTSHARNLGAQMAQGRLIYFIDDDCYLPNHLHLKKVMTMALTLGSNSCFGGSYSNSKNSSYLSRFYNAMVDSWAKTNRYIPGGNLICPKQIIHQYPFDSFFQTGGEEVEWQNRLRENGISVNLRRELNIVHDVKSNWSHLLRRAFFHGASRRKQQNLPAHTWNIRKSFTAARNFSLVHWPVAFLYFATDQMGYWSVRWVRRQN